ncbi:piRNA biogenesis protein EXD1 isoform X2 [Alligator mississippiensis]|uniref:piRNA biogenesis protein EXD1 isoform X2 n=1 Tax=Alligator mississippiensis TaxID=8496 RepID=UPI0028775C0E|nr:piRNA biogenesis protein EXD1 isoform X2 [Alligator mississippiensis]
MDLSSDYQFLNKILGRTMKITLKCGLFQGVLQHVDSNKSILLSRVKNLESGRSMPGVKMFFGHEILNVELLDELEQGAGRGTETLPGDSPVTEGIGMAGREPVEQSSSTCVSPENQDTTLKDEEEDVEYIVIDQFQQKFGSAILHIKEQIVLSVAAEGVSLCRYGKLCWFQVATRSRVFLFDIFLLGPRAFKNGLQMVLEDENILKVIHDCRWISDCLSHKYGIILSNVFDTQVADVLQFSVMTGGFLPHRISTLEECLIRHLKMSPKSVSFMRRKQQAVQENLDVWFVRPLPPSLLKVLALETVYLLPLRLMFLDEMMSDLTTLVDGYLNAYREGSSVQLGNTESSCMDLPVELRQLADFQKLRREKAVKEYRVNEEGLLIRPALEFKGKKAAEKEANHGEDNSHVLPSETLQKTSFHMKDPPCQETDNEEAQEENFWENDQSRLDCKIPSLEVGAEAGNLVNSALGDFQGMQKGQCSMQEPQTPATLSLQREMNLLLMEDNEKGLSCRKQTTISASIFPKMSSSLQNCHILELPPPSVLPPWPALKTAVLQQNSLKMSSSCAPRFQVRPERERFSALRFAFPSTLGYRMPAPSPLDK